MADDTMQLDLINDILAGNFNNAEKALHQSLLQKQNDVLDQEKIKIAGQIFNNIQPEEDDELSDEEIDNAAAEDEEVESEEETDNESSEDEDE